MIWECETKKKNLKENISKWDFAISQTVKITFLKMNYQNNSPQNVQIPLYGDHQKNTLIWENFSRETFANPNIRKIGYIFANWRI